MTILLVVLTIAIAAGLLMLRVAATHHRVAKGTSHLASQLAPVDVNALRNLMDKREDEYLRRNLPPPEFRSIQRERRLAAVEYVRCAGRNASILVRVAQIARLDSDPAIAQAGEKLFENAVRLRLYAFRTLPWLYYGALFPGTMLSPARVADAYDSVTRQVVMLGCLQRPAQEISAAL